jgi:hypothetical protein
MYDSLQVTPHLCGTTHGAGAINTTPNVMGWGNSEGQDKQAAQGAPPSAAVLHGSGGAETRALAEEVLQGRTGVLLEVCLWR